MKRFTLLLGAALLLAACSSLTAQLLQGSHEFTYTVAYAHDDQKHTMTATITVKDGQIIALAIEPGAASGIERAHQLAFSANVRRFLLEKNVSDVTLPAEGVGEETWITQAFAEVIAKLKKEL